MSYIPSSTIDSYYGSSYSQCAFNLLGSIVSFQVRGMCMCDIFCSFVLSDLMSSRINASTQNLLLYKTNTYFVASQFLDFTSSG
jgi:hypothetical protein